MGIFETFTDMLEAALPWGEARAEAAEAEEKDDEKVCFVLSPGSRDRVDGRDGTACLRFGGLELARVCTRLVWT